jgi:hypothetical protein
VHKQIGTLVAVLAQKTKKLGASFNAAGRNASLLFMSLVAVLSAVMQYPVEPLPYMEILRSKPYAQNAEPLPPGTAKGHQLIVSRQSGVMRRLGASLVYVVT